MILAIAEGLAPWIAAGIVTLTLFVAAGIAALVGRKNMTQVGDAPHERTESLKADVTAVRHGTNGDSHEQ